MLIGEVVGFGYQKGLKDCSVGESRLGIIGYDDGKRKKLGAQDGREMVIYSNRGRSEEEQEARGFPVFHGLHHISILNHDDGARFAPLAATSTRQAPEGWSKQGTAQHREQHSRALGLDSAPRAMCQQ